MHGEPHVRSANEHAGGDAGFERVEIVASENTAVSALPVPLDPGRV